MALLLFGLGSMGFWAGSSFQDALIMQVADRAESNRVSALGFALGYLGGGLLFLLNVALVLYPARFHLADATAAMRVAFVDVAVWWIVFTLPMFRHVGEPPPTDEQAGWRELWATIRSVLRDRPVLQFSAGVLALHRRHIDRADHGGGFRQQTRIFHRVR